VTLASRAVGPFRLCPALPGDKSITHRAYLLGALARGATRVTGANTGADCRATLAALSRLGVTVAEDPGGVTITGTGGRFRAPAEPLDLGNSGTGLRLLCGVLAAQPFRTVLTGDTSLRRRPVERVLEPLRQMGAAAAAVGDHPPVTLDGAALAGIRHRLAVPSAQVKSALVLAGLQAAGTTRVEGTRGTRDHTERMLAAFGAALTEDADWVEITGPQALRGAVVHVPKDPSAAMVYLAAAAILPGSQVTLEDVGLNPTRINGFRVLQDMGLVLETVPGDASGGEPRGRVTARGGALRGITLAPEAVAGIIDELPVLAVAAAFAEGETTVRGAGELRVKESDRLAAVAAGLDAVGAAVTLHADGWTIRGSGGRPLRGGRVESRGDHRIAMAFLVAGLRTRDGVVITDPGGIETSDPLFPRNLNRILGEDA
jgi:3-phosphoshikimate 1-carboxyvinyltransferase